jgi:hypothetical protein
MPERTPSRARSARKICDIRFSAGEAGLLGACSLLGHAPRTRKEMIPMKLRSAIASSLGMATTLVLFGCGGGQAKEAASATKLQGAGASFPAPLYTKWFKT